MSYARVGKVLFVEVARKRTVTEQTCRGSFRKTGIYPFNLKAVLDKVLLKEIGKGRLTPAEPTSIIPLAVNITETTPGPKQKARNPVARHQLAETLYNTAAVQSHAIAVLNEFDSLAV